MKTLPKIHQLTSTAVGELNQVVEGDRRIRLVHSHHIIWKPYVSMHIAVNQCIGARTQHKSYWHACTSNGPGAGMVITVNTGVPLWTIIFYVRFIYSPNYHYRGPKLYYLILCFDKTSDSCSTVAEAECALVLWNGIIDFWIHYVVKIPNDGHFVSVIPMPYIVLQSISLHHNAFVVPYSWPEPAESSERCKMKSLRSIFNSNIWKWVILNPVIYH